jgi:Holliday junction resolvase RusA-like endonuclease
MRGKKPLDEALSVSVGAFMPIPASFSKAKRQAALDFDLMPTGKPDADNLGKTVDSLNGVVWRDDSSIVRMLVTKFYSAHPRLEITVWRWNG